MAAVPDANAYAMSGSATSSTARATTETLAMSCSLQHLHGLKYRRQAYVPSADS